MGKLLSSGIVVIVVTIQTSVWSETAQAQSDPPPTLDRCCPVAGVAGTPLKIGLLGKNFKADMKVFVDGTATTVDAVSPTRGQAIVSSPALTTGAHTVTVTTPTGDPTAGSSGAFQIRPQGGCDFSQIVATGQAFVNFTQGTDQVFKDGVRTSIISKMNAFLASFQRFDFNAANGELGALSNYLNTLTSDRASSQFIAFALSVVDNVLIPCAQTFSVFPQEKQPCKVEFPDKDFKVKVEQTGSATVYKITIDGTVKVTPDSEQGGSLTAEVVVWKDAPCFHRVTVTIGAQSPLKNGPFHFEKDVDLKVAIPPSTDALLANNIIVRVVGTCKSGGGSSIARAFHLEGVKFAEDSAPNPTLTITGKAALQEDKDTKKPTHAIVTASVKATGIDESVKIEVTVRAFAKLQNPANPSEQTDGLIDLGAVGPKTKDVTTPAGTFQDDFDFDLVKRGADNAVGTKNEVVVGTLQFFISAELLGCKTATAAKAIEVTTAKK